MNERIRQLADEAQKVAYYTDGGYTPIMTLDQEKFAELIVRECAEVAADVVRDAEGVEFGLIEACYKHFGVKP
jgi:N-acetylglutamate synthase/N-acetylornithine aminotransferase